MSYRAHWLAEQERIKALPPRAATPGATPIYLPQQQALVDPTSGLISRAWWPTFERIVTAIQTLLAGGGGGGGTGDVTGPAGAVDDHLALFDGSTGKVIADSGVNVASLVQTNAGNVFTSNQTIQKAAPGLILIDTAQPANAKRFEIQNSGGRLRFEADNDAGAVQAVVTIDRNGVLTATGLDGTPLDATHLQGLVPLASLPAHGPTHTAAGADAIKLDTLATPDDVTTLNATTARHGLLPKLSGAATQFLTGVGTWAAASGGGGGDVTGPASAGNANLAVYNGTSGKVIMDGGVPVSGLATSVHHARHEPGGADALQLTAASRLFGRGSASGAGAVQEISLGTNLTLAGTVLNAAGGGSGGGDVFGPASSNINGLPAFADATGKKLLDSGQSVTNLAYINIQNQFFEDQLLQKNGGIRLIISDASQAAGQRRFGIFNSGGTLKFQDTNDSNAAAHTPLTINRAGGMIFAGTVTHQSSVPVFQSIDTNEAVDARLFRWVNNQQKLTLTSMNDVGTVTQATPLTVARDGSVTIGKDLTATGTGGNVALRTAENTFTADQKLSAATPALWLIEPAQPADQRAFRLSATAQYGYIQAVNDAGTIEVGRPLVWNRPGDVYIGRDVYEKGRLAPVGHWTTTPYFGGDYGGPPPMSWVVTAGQVQTNRWTLVGKTLTWTVMVAGATLGGSPGIELRVVLPAPYSAAVFTTGLGAVQTGGVWAPALVQLVEGTNYVSIYLLTLGAYTLGAMSLRFVLPLEVA